MRFAVPFSSGCFGHRLFSFPMKDGRGNSAAFSRGGEVLFGRGEALLRSKQPGSMRCRRRARKKGDAESEPRKGLASAEGALKKYGGKPEKRKAV